jgi:hypothetical protein
MKVSPLAALGEWCFRNPRTVLLLWTLVFIGGLLAGGAMLGRLDVSGVPRTFESVQGRAVLQT